MSVGLLWQACWFPPGDNLQSQHVQDSTPPLSQQCQNFNMFYTVEGRITWRRLGNSPLLLCDFRRSWSPFAHQNLRDQKMTGKHLQEKITWADSGLFVSRFLTLVSHWRLLSLKRSSRWFHIIYVWNDWMEREGQPCWSCLNQSSHWASLLPPNLLCLIITG